MHSCELTIITKSGEGLSTFRAACIAEETQEGVRIRYQIEGDEGELLLSENSLTMSRSGKCGLQATFLKGKQTEMIISDSALVGSIPVRTTKYHLQKQNKKATVELKYELLGGADVQTFSLKILVFFSEEK